MHAVKKIVFRLVRKDPRIYYKFPVVTKPAARFCCNETSQGLHVLGDALQVLGDSLQFYSFNKSVTL